MSGAGRGRVGSTNGRASCRTTWSLGLRSLPSRLVVPATARFRTETIVSYTLQVAIFRFLLRCACNSEFSFSFIVVSFEETRNKSSMVEYHCNDAAPLGLRVDLSWQCWAFHGGLSRTTGLGALAIHRGSRGTWYGIWSSAAASALSSTACPEEEGVMVHLASFFGFMYTFQCFILKLIITPASWRHHDPSQAYLCWDLYIFNASFYKVDK
jgi:hypothetical protein